MPNRYSINCIIYSILLVLSSLLALKPLMPSGKCIKCTWLYALCSRRCIVKQAPFIKCRLLNPSSIIISTLIRLKTGARFKTGDRPTYKINALFDVVIKIWNYSFVATFSVQVALVMKNESVCLCVLETSRMRGAVSWDSRHAVCRETQAVWEGNRKSEFFK